MNELEQKQRLDKWLHFARFFKTRSLAATRISAGDIRIDSQRVFKPAHFVKPGNVLTFMIGTHVRVIKIKSLGHRRGPAPEAQLLYSDLSPERPAKEDKVLENPRFEGKGRPTKRDRRQGDFYRQQNARNIKDLLE